MTKYKTYNKYEKKGYFHIVKSREKNNRDLYNFRCIKDEDLDTY